MPRPDRIFQILIAEGAVTTAAPDTLLEACTASFRDAYPGAAYTLYDGPAARRLIADAFGADVVRAYDLLRPGAFKADLARYCILHELGGVYSDLSHRHLCPISPAEDTSMVVFRDLPEHPPWSVANGLIFARPKRPELARAVQEIVRYGEERFQGAHPLDPTGPYLFGRVLAASRDWRRIVFGHSEHARTFLGRRRAAGRAVHVRKRLPDGTVVAEKIKAAAGEIGDLTGAAGDNYIRIWRQGEMWKDDRA